MSGGLGIPIRRFSLPTFQFLRLFLNNRKKLAILALSRQEQSYHIFNSKNSLFRLSSFQNLLTNSRSFTGKLIARKR